MPKWSRGLIKKVRKVARDEREAVFTLERNDLILRSLVPKDMAETIQMSSLPQVIV